MSGGLDGITPRSEWLVFGPTSITSRDSVMDVKRLEHVPPLRRDHYTFTLVERFGQQAP